MFEGWTWREKCSFLWTHNHSLAAFRMGAFIPLAEFLEELRKECSSN